jgi:hypothetical protein
VAGRKKQRETPRPERAMALHEPATALALGVLLFAALFFFRSHLLGTAFLWEDFLYHDYPSRTFAAVSLAGGEIPLWNPYTFSGMPFLADIQKTVFYLPMTALALVVREGTLDPWWVQLVIILHYALAGGGMFFLARSYGLRRGPSVFAGAAFMLSGFMITHAIHQYIVTLVAWYPVILLCFRRALAGEWRWVFLGALVLGHSILAGFPQLSLYFYYFLLAYFLFELFSTHRGAALLSRPAAGMALRAAAVVALSVMLAAVQLLPTMELAELSQRAQITYQKATEGQLSWIQLVTFFAPKAFGTAGAAGYEYYGPGTYWYYWETCVYLGVLPLLLSLLSLRLFRRDRHVAFFWGYALFAIVFALGENGVLHRIFYEVVPGFSTFRNAARMGVFVAFAASILSAFALQELLHGTRSARDLRGHRTILAVAAGAGALLWLLSFTGGFRSALGVPADPAVVSTFSADTGTAFVLLLTGAGVLLLILRPAGPPRFAWVALVAVHLADMLVFGGSQNNGTTDPKEYFARSAGLVQAVRAQGGDEVFRVNTRIREGMVMDRNQGMMDRIQMMEGYTPLVLQRVYPPGNSWDQVLDMMNAKFRTVVDPANPRSLRLVASDTYMPRATMVYEAKVLRDSAAIHGFMTAPEFNPRAVVVLEEDPPVRPAGSGDERAWQARVTSYGLNRITLEVTTPADGILLLSEIHYPGWRASVDGMPQPVLRANWNQRAVALGAGSHAVEMTYEPEPFRRGGWITLAALVLCGAGLAVPRLRRRAPAATGDAP